MTKIKPQSPVPLPSEERSAQISSPKGGDVARPLKVPLEVDELVSTAPVSVQGEAVLEEGGSVLNRFLDNLDSLAGSVLGKKFRPGKAIDLMTHFETKDEVEIERMARSIKTLTRLRRYPMMAHLIGSGGEFDFKTHGSSQKVALEGLYTRESINYLPRIFEGVARLAGTLLDGTASEARGDAAKWTGVLDTVAECWAWESHPGQLNDRVFNAKRYGNVPSTMEVVASGWRQPKGHAVGFVYAREGGEDFIYACNAGDYGDDKRTTVKYSVRDQQLLQKFLDRADWDKESIRTFWSRGPESSGLKRCPESDQIPLKIERASQKRGNCPIAFRKSCQLAMLWSLGKERGLSAKEIKTVYKMTTTLIRTVGVRSALEEGNPEFLGNTLVSMISKWDRPDCRRLAFEVADALVEHHGGVALGLNYRATSLTELTSDTYVQHIKTALDLAGVDLGGVRVDGVGLVDFAKYSDNTSVVKILRKLGV
ncbi:MAG: hypothetical protein VX699_01760 [Myxococcota bacterium]|nr:hypothetical protein [Myxococcota bacterium]